jgi:hypothetical protein
MSSWTLNDQHLYSSRDDERLTRVILTVGDVRPLPTRSNQLHYGCDGLSLSFQDSQSDGHPCNGDAVHNDMSCSGPPSNHSGSFNLLVSMTRMANLSHSRRHPRFEYSHSSRSTNGQYTSVQVLQHAHSRSILSHSQPIQGAESERQEQAVGTSRLTYTLGTSEPKFKPELDASL